MTNAFNGFFMKVCVILRWTWRHHHLRSILEEEHYCMISSIVECYTFLFPNTFTHRVTFFLSFSLVSNSNHIRQKIGNYFEHILPIIFFLIDICSIFYYIKSKLERIETMWLLKYSYSNFYIFQFYKLRANLYLKYKY